MPDDIEAARIRAVYARRDRLGLETRYDYWRPHNLFIYQARERAVLGLLDAAGFLPLAGKQVIDIGCGDGAVLLDFQRYGAAADALAGIDLLPDRVASARARLPAARIELGDARALPFEDDAFDLTLSFTLISTLVEPLARRTAAAEMARVTRPGGIVLVYDFWTNPTNRHVRPLRRSEVRELFGGKRIDFQGTTLAPPLTRLLFRLPGGRVACTQLDVIPFLRTHFVAAVHV